MSNLSVLQRNVILALDNELAAEAFLRACDRTTVLLAEQFALEVKNLVGLLEPALATAARQYGRAAVPDGLMRFILDRHWHWRFPSKVPS